MPSTCSVKPGSTTSSSVWGLGLVVLSAAGCGSAPDTGAAVATEPAPLRLTPQHADLGACYVGDRRSVELTLANATAAPIDLEHIEVSCGCQHLELDGAELPRDGAGIMRARLLPGTHTLRMTIVPPRAGERHVWLRLLGGGHMIVGDYVVHGHDELSVQPEAIVLEGAQVGQTREFTAEVVAHDGGAFALAVERVADALDGVVVEPVAQGRVRVRGRATPQARGPGSADVHLRSDRRFADWVYVVVRWDIPEPCTVEPAVLAFGVVRGMGTEALRELVITTPASAAAPQLSLEVQPRDAVVQVGEARSECIGERRVTRVHFAPGAGTARGAFRGAVQVHAEGSTTTVPVTGFHAAD